MYCIKCTCTCIVLSVHNTIITFLCFIYVYVFYFLHVQCNCSCRLLVYTGVVDTYLMEKPKSLPNDLGLEIVKVGYIPPLSLSFSLYPSIHLHISALPLSTPILFFPVPASLQSRVNQHVHYNYLSTGVSTQIKRETSQWTICTGRRATERRND